MKNFLKTIAFAALVTGLVAPVLSFGQDIKTAVEGAGSLPAGKDINFLTIINRALNFAFAALVIVAVFFMLWAAYEYMTGNDKGAKTRIMNSAIALAIGLLAKGLPYLVNAIIGIGPTPIL